MSQRRGQLANNVFEAAINRLVEQYEGGHRLVVSFSAGKDSGVVLELAIMAAKMTGNLPVDVVMRDEEIMVPGTFEYAERIANRPEVRFHWLIANQPVINIFNRAAPYYWTFDPQLPPEKWVRTPPERAIYIADKNIERMTTPERFPVPEGKDLFAVVGMRCSESMGRHYGIFAARGHITAKKPSGARNMWPIYDWKDADVWKAISQFKWDYNRCYDVLYRMGIPHNRLRVAPIAMNQAAAESLPYAARAWPRWFDKVTERLPGVRQVTLFGIKATEPTRRLGETWEQCFHRECIDNAPAEWIAERATKARDSVLSMHGHHSTEGTGLPESVPCYNCTGNIGCWRMLTKALYNGDPFALKASMLKAIEPEFFRVGAGTWGGSPSF